MPLRADEKTTCKRLCERFKAVRSVSSNAEMRPAEIRDYCELDAAGQSPIKAEMGQLPISACAYHQILKLSRTMQIWRGARG